MLHNVLWPKSTEWLGTALSRAVSLLLPTGVGVRYFTAYIGLAVKSTCLVHLCSILFQDVCGLSPSWHTLHVDRLHHMLWRLCNYSWGVWRLLGRRRGSRVTVAPYHGSDCARAVYSRRHLLQRTSGNYGRPEDLAKTLPHPRQTNANKGEHCSSLAPLEFFNHGVLCL
jgi:hypothetical protein